MAAFDDKLPGFGGLGVNLSFDMREKGLNCYVVNAPLIHQYRTAQNKPIRRAYDSGKVQSHITLQWQAQQACCFEYLAHQWPDFFVKKAPLHLHQKAADYFKMLESLPDTQLHRLERPIILLARGGGGSRLLATLANDYGIFRGRMINNSGDSLEMVMAIYQGIIRKYTCPAAWQKELIITHLKMATAKMLRHLKDKNILWGFKLPESLLLLPELNQAFPNALYIHMFRHPVATCLGRPHLTAKLDNIIGRITLPLAYREAGIAPEKIPVDSPVVHMAYTTLHQVGFATDYCRYHFDSSRYYECRFEDLILDPDGALKSLGVWLGVKSRSNRLKQQVNVDRAMKSHNAYSLKIMDEVTEIVAPLLKTIPYASDDPLQRVSLT